MSAKDIASIVSIPWIPGSKLKIRPMSMADERKLLSNLDEIYAYSELVQNCVEPLEGFIWDRDYTFKERDYLLSQIRMLTYGDEMILSGYKCPHCGFINSNHLVHISKYNVLPQQDKVIYTFESSEVGIPESRISYLTYKRLDQIKELIKKEDLDGDKAIHRELEYSSLGIFLDIEIDKVMELADSGKLSLHDIRKAIHLLESDNAYGYDYRSTMTCHHKDCEKEFNIELAVICPGMLVPYFPNSGGTPTEDGTIRESDKEPSDDSEVL